MGTAQHARVMFKLILEVRRCVVDSIAKEGFGSRIDVDDDDDDQWWEYDINVNDEQSIDKAKAEDVSLDEGDISALAKNTNAVLDEAQIENIKEIKNI